MRNLLLEAKNPEASTRRIIIVTLGTILSIVFLGVIIYLQKDSFLSVVSWSNAPQLAALMAIHVVLLGLTGLSLASFTARFDVNLKPTEWYGLPVVTAFTNLISPIASGFVIRAGYLRQRYHLPMTTFASLTGGYYIIVYSLISLIAFVTLGMRLLSGASESVLPLIIVGGIVIGLLMMMVLPLNRLLPLLERVRFLQPVGRILQGWHAIRTSPQLVTQQILIALGSQTMRILALIVGLSAFGIRIAMLDAVLVMTLTSLSIIFRLTPGGIGLSEGLTGLGYTLVGGDALMGVSASVLIRVASLPVLLVLGPIFVRILTRRLLQEPTLPASA